MPIRWKDSSRGKPLSALAAPSVVRRISWRSRRQSAGRMKENLERSRGVVFSGTILLELARRGLSREQSYESVQRNAMRAFHEKRDFKELLLADEDVTRVLSRGDIERAFDLNEQLKHVDHIFQRVFQEHSEVVGAGLASSVGR